MADIMIGLGMVAALAAVLASAVGRERTAELRLADDRAAVRVAEHALLDLQNSQPLPPLPADVRVAVHAVSDAPVAPAGFAWADVEATVRGRQASLVGIVPAGAMRAVEGGAR
jgi:hypothetical protein